MTEKEDSAKMTVEFLRARLLAERSVSKSARQRADELAERVVELEEQLKSVTLQRNRAEQATAEVLAILGHHRVSDFSDTFDSSSDQEGFQSESESIGHEKKQDSSVTSKARANKLEFSGSELKTSVTSRSLSWKNCTKSPTSSKSEYIDQTRRSSSFISRSGSSSRRNMGKSCRQIKRKEIRSGPDEVKGESFQHGAQRNGEPITSGDTSNDAKDGSIETTGERSKTKEEKVFLEDMERALEHQAQLIVQYEAEENAQREWEEKFRENSGSNPDPGEAGNQSDITEERDEIKAETVDPPDTIPSHVQGVRSDTAYGCHYGDKVDKPLANGVVPTVHAEMGCLSVQQDSRMVDKFSTSLYFPSQSKTETNTREKEKLDLLDKSVHQPLHASSEDRRPHKSESYACDNFCKGDSLVGRSKPQVVPLHESEDSFYGVLEALRHAKSSLKHELNRSPLSGIEGPMVGATDAPFPAIKVCDAMEIPVGCAGLFRVPTDLKSENTHYSQMSLLGPFPDSHLSLTRNYPNMGVGGAARDRYTASPYMESGSGIATQKSYLDTYTDMSRGVPATSRYTYPPYADLASPYMDSGSGISTQKSYLDTYMDMSRGVPATSRYTYPPYADLVLKMPSGYGDGIQRLPSIGTIPSGRQNYIYHDHIRPNIHK